MNRSKLIWILRILILTLFSLGYGNVYAEYYIVTEPYSEYSYTTYDSPEAYAEQTSSRCGSCSSYHPKHHYHHCHHPVKHYRHHYRTCHHRYRSYNHSAGCMYTSTHYSSPVFFNSNDEEELDLDRRTADDVRAELQIND